MIFIYRKIFAIVFLGFFLCSISSSQLLADEHQLIRDKLQSWVVNGKTQQEIALKLEVDPSTISRFLDKTIERSPKILGNFKKKYPQEYQIVTTPKQPQKTLTTQILQKLNVNQEYQVITPLKPSYTLTSPIYYDESQLIRNKLKDWIKGGKTQQEIALKLEVDPSTISRFLDKTIEHSPKILRNFKAKYSREYQTLTTPRQVQKTSTTQIAEHTKVVRKLDFNL
jgi:DNA-binding CsgD family transcriptional regulator